MSRIQNAKKTRELRKQCIPERSLFLSMVQLQDELGRRSSSRGILLHSAKNLELKPEILHFTQFLPANTEWIERTYCIQNSITERKLCEHCLQQPVSFAQRNVGYHRYCSRSCSANAESTKAARAISNIEKYGDAIAFNNPEVRIKHRETLIQRYGVTNSWHLAKHSGISKISQELFWNVWQNCQHDGEFHFGELNGEIRLNLNGKIFKPDFAKITDTDKRIIEFDGGYWHNEESASADLIRENAIKSDGWKVLRIKERHYLNDKFNIIDKCVAFLNGELE